MRPDPRLLPLASLLGCGYVAPDDPNAPPVLGGIQGTLVYAGPGRVEMPTYAILFRAIAPAPPDGLGSPVTFAAVGPDAWSSGPGVSSAPFALTRLPADAYQLNAVIDVDGDFSPFSSALAGATCGDWVGTHLANLTSTDWAPVTVANRHLTEEVTVLVGAEVPLERPAFTIATPRLSLTEIAGGAPPLFRLRSTGVATAFSEELPLQLGPNCAPPPDPPAPYPPCAEQPACACDPATLAPCGTSIFLQVVDADADGLPDPNPDPDLAANGILDIWPRVYLEYVGEELPTFEYEGRELPERWVNQGFPLLGELATVLPAVGGDPVAAFGALGVPIGAPSPTYELSVTFVPVFVHYHADGVLIDEANGPYDVVDLANPSTPPGAVPLGGWAVTTLAPTGQTWTVPNEIGLLGLPSLDPGFDPLTQGAVLAIIE